MIGKIGKLVKMGQVFDTLFSALTFSNIFGYAQ